MVMWWILPICASKYSRLAESTLLLVVMSTSSLILYLPFLPFQLLCSPGLSQTSTQAGPTTRYTSATSASQSTSPLTPRKYSPKTSISSLHPPTHFHIQISQPTFFLVPPPHSLILPMPALIWPILLIISLSRMRQLSTRSP